MKRLVFLLIALLVVPSYGEKSASTKSNESGSGCHFESDGRYVCGSGTSSEEMSVDNEKDIGYIGEDRFSGCALKP